MTRDALQGSLEVSTLFRRLCFAPADGQCWFLLGTPKPGDSVDYLNWQLRSLCRSLTLSPLDEAATRAFLREILRSEGAPRALERLFTDERVSRSYESMGTLAVDLLNSGETLEAIGLLRRCLVFSPERREAAERLGLAFLDSGGYADAAACLRTASTIEPDNDNLRSQWIFARFRAGERRLYVELQRIAGTGQRLQPLLNAGMAAVDGQHWRDAVLSMSKALALFPDSAPAWSKSGIPLVCLGQFSSARIHIERSLTIDPSWLEARVNLGRVYEGLGNFRAAISEYEDALAIRPALSEPRLNAGTCYLGLGQFERGWQYYQARWNAQSVVNYGRELMSRYFHTGRPSLRRLGEFPRVLVWTEQGIGDEIMFCSMLQELRDQSRAVLVTLDNRLVKLFARSLPDIHFFGRNQEVAEDLYDCHLPMGDLGGLFRQNLSQFEGRGIGFLRTDPSRLQEFESLLDAHRSFVIGISWRSANPNTGSARSIALELLISTLDRPQLKFVCLQYGKDVADEIRAVRDRTDIDIQLLPNLDLTMDLDGVAAAAVACDLVVSVGNSVAHIAAACGCPTWLLASVGASWRWMFEGERTPWYDSVRIFRQKKLGDWDVVLEQLSAALDAKLRDELR